MESYPKWVNVTLLVVRFFFFVVMWPLGLLKLARKLKKYLRQRGFAGSSSTLLYEVLKESRLFSKIMKMLISWISDAPRETTSDSRYDEFQGLLSTRFSPSFADSIQTVLGKKEAWSALSGLGNHIHHGSCLTSEGEVDPFALVRNELSVISKWLRSLVASEVPEFSSAAEYYFKPGVDGKKMRMTILLLMAKSFGSRKPGDSSTVELREKQCIMAGIVEMIHVASLMHDDVIDEADTRRGVGSLNSVMGNKVAILAGDYLVAKVIVALAALQNGEALLSMGTATVDLITGETMQMADARDKFYNMEFYLRKSYNKTASLISNGCKAMAFLSAQTEEVATLAFDYGKNLGLAYQLMDDVLDFTGTSKSLGKPAMADIQNGIITAPMLYAIEEFPQLRGIIDQGGFDDPSKLETAVEYVRKANGIEKARELARKHAQLAADAVQSLPETVDKDVLVARQALVRLTQIVLTREK